jgi:hypothetical protein
MRTCSGVTTMAGFFILHIPVRATPSTAALTRASVVGLVLPASLCMLAIAARLISIVDAAYNPNDTTLLQPATIGASGVASGDCTAVGHSVAVVTGREWW